MVPSPHYAGNPPTADAIHLLTSENGRMGATIQSNSLESIGWDIYAAQNSNRFMKLDVTGNVKANNTPAFDPYDMAFYQQNGVVLSIVQPDGRGDGAVDVDALSDANPAPGSGPSIGILGSVMKADPFIAPSP